MNEFEKIYLSIIKESDDRTSANFYKFDGLNENQGYDIINENTLKIIDEYVQDPELTPIPKEVLNAICSRIKYRRENIQVISFKEIHSLLRENEYPYYEEFKNNLLKRSSFNGNLYLVLLFKRDFDNEMLEFNKTNLFLYEKLKNHEIADSLCKELLNPRLKYADAFCSITDESIENESFYRNNAMIFISLKTEFVKDSLEHELTHLVQKIVGLDESLSSIVSSSKFNSFFNNDKESFNRLFNWIKEFTDNDQNKMNFAFNFFKTKFNERELHQSVKAILNGIQRIYEYGKFDYLKELDLSKREIDLNESNNNIEFRINWLEKFFKTINSIEFINDLKKIIFGFLDIEEQQEYIIKYRSYFIVFLYFGMKRMFINMNIDEKIKDHFKTFKYKDN